MAVTFVYYDTATPMGGLLSVAVNKLTEGRQLLDRWYEAANAATNAGTAAMNLIGGDFGAVTSADATLMWAQAPTIKNLLDADDPGGLAIALGSLDQGVPG